MNDPLLVIVPSRERPRNIAELAAHFGPDTDSAGYATLLVCLDSDDPTVGDYPPARPGLFYDVGPCRGFAPRLSDAARIHAGQRYALASWGDDHRPRTAGWAQSIVDALRALGSGFVYTNDLIHGAAIPTACAMTADVVRTLGWMTPPGFDHWYVDNVWKELGEAWGQITYLDEVIVEHCHPLVGTAYRDPIYEKEDRYAISDRARFQTWVNAEKRMDVRLLRELSNQKGITARD